MFRSMRADRIFMALFKSVSKKEDHIMSSKKSEFKKMFETNSELCFFGGKLASMLH